MYVALSYWKKNHGKGEDTSTDNNDLLILSHFYTFSILFMCNLLILLIICFFRTNAGELWARNCFWIHVLLRLFFDLWLALWEKNAGLGRPLVWSSKTILTFWCCQLILFMFCATSSRKWPKFVFPPMSNKERKL